MGSNERKLIVDKVDREASKLEKRFKDAEQRFKVKAHQFDEKIINSYKRRKALFEDKRDFLSQQRQTDKIRRNAEKIKKIIFNSESPISGHERRQLIKLVAKIQSAYADLSEAFESSTKKVSETELDSYYNMGVNIAELSEDLVDLLLDKDEATPSLALATSIDIEESCDTLTQRIHSKYSKAA